MNAAKYSRSTLDIGESKAYLAKKNILTSSVHAWVKDHSNLNGNSSTRYFNFNKRLLNPSLMFASANSSIDACSKSLFNKSSRYVGENITAHVSIGNGVTAAGRLAERTCKTSTSTRSRPRVTEEEDVLLGSKPESLQGAQKELKEGLKPSEGNSLGTPERQHGREKGSLLQEE
uniref:Uncharacterized protein n=1 Tax=Glossina palpalis gambiensis TaxID=67801 RepID=A0A1B0C610_9MUSC